MIEVRHGNRCGRARDVDLAEGLQQVIRDGAPAQAARAGEFSRLLDDAGLDDAADQAARDLVRAFLHDPDLWR